MDRLVAYAAATWLLAAGACAATRSSWPLALPHALFAANELAYCTAGAELVAARDRTAVFYDLAALVDGGVDRNYSEGFFPDGDTSIGGAAAEEAKFAEILRVLDARPGQTVLDLGCGLGNFMRFCRARGLRAVGLTLSARQAAVCVADGLDVRVLDFMARHRELERCADHVVILGSPEHVHGGCPLHWSAYRRKRRLMTRLFSHVRAYSGLNLSWDAFAHTAFFSPTITHNLCVVN